MNNEQLTMKLLRVPAVILVTLVLFSGCRQRSIIITEGDIFERMRQTTHEMIWVFPGWAFQPDQQLVTDAINDKLTEMGYPGLSIRLEGVDWAAFDMGRITAIIMSGQNYDLVYAPLWVPYQGDAFSGGGWQPWDPFINLLPEYSTMIEPWLEMIQQQGPDGHIGIYRLPTMKEFATIPLEMRFNRTVADKLGITEDLYAVTDIRDLTPFLEMYQDAYPVGMPVLAVGTGSVINAFQLRGDPYEPRYNDRTGRLEAGIFAEWYDDYIAFRRDWYARGFVQDFQLTASTEDLMTRFGPESFLVYFNAGKPGGEAELNMTSDRLGFEWGTTFLSPAIMTQDSILGNSWALNAKSRNPEASAFIYQLICTSYELNALLNFGIEGLHYTYDSDGVLHHTEGSRYAPNLMWMIGNRLLSPRLPGEPENLLELYEEYNNSAIKMPDFGFGIPDEAWLGVNTDLYWGVVSALWTQYSRSIEIGIITDDEIRDMRTKLLNGGYQAFYEIYNREFEIFRASGQGDN